MTPGVSALVGLIAVIAFTPVKTCLGADAVRPKGDVRFSVFVGRYGETFDFSDDSVVEAEMHGPIEVVRIHPKYADSEQFKLFHPKPADYVPAKFDKLGLQELMVIPKGLPGGYSSLAQIKSAKLSGARKSRVAFEVVDLGPRVGYPRGSFEIVTKSPYRFWQAYSESPKEFFIYSTGGAGEFDSIESSLSDYLHRSSF